MEKKRLTSIRLSPEAKRLLTLLARTLSISQSAVLELSIREKAHREKVT
jgi:predicted transcriptional regulator